MKKNWLVVAGAMGALGVILGAFGAHVLKQRLTPDLFEIFEVGVRYHMYHVLAMFAAALVAYRREPAMWMGRACVCWLAGIVVFSGSLYLLAVTGASWLGAVTPIGGLSFIAGWVCVCIAARAYRTDSEGATART